jgi:hypothetical protein
MGELRTTPKYIVLSDPTTNKVMLNDFRVVFGSNPSAHINFDVVDANLKVKESRTIVIQNQLDDPDTPDVDESTTVFTDLMSGIGTTLKSRIDALAWAYILANYTTQDTP